jgi:hypothetical protein
MIRPAAVLLVVLLVGFGRATAFAQNMPPGSYRQSCTNVRVNGNLLTASCSAANGGRITSSIPMGCSGDIGNVNGSLRCNGGGRPGGFPNVPPPGGSYTQSCTNVRVNGGQLTASCSAPNGHRITSSTSLACNGDIGNVSGYLRCNGNGSGNGHGHGHGHGGGGGYLGGAPNGSYQQSCGNVRMQGSTLIATCSAANGQRITSSIDLRYCRPGGDIGNVNGNLNCRRQ